MTIYLYNTLTRQKEEFKPIDAKNVRLYACGPTVHNYAHIGNARPAVIFDLLARLLRYHYGSGHVRYVRNITDIDDKIIEASKVAGEPIAVLTEKFARVYSEDMAALGVGKPDVQPKATDYIPQMLAMIATLVERGFAYEAEGHVLFHVPAWKEYGGLSRLKSDDLIAGARVEVAPYKKNPADFVLWKPSTQDQPGWDSPYGRGRPGWHLECSAMNEALNGNHFDIHAGGEDLIFPHHENEIAQSTCAHGGEKYANVWMHNGHLMVEGQKMSKSLGNVLLVHDLIREYQPEALRFVLLSAHYRQPFDFTKDGVAQASRTLDRYYRLLEHHRDVENLDTEPPADFMAALDDDLNTPQALAEIAAAAGRLSRAVNDAEKRQGKGELLAAGALLGLLQQDAAAWFQAVGDDEKIAIEAKIALMQDARRNKDYKKSDEIRDALQKEHSVTVSVAHTGITWRKE